LRFRFVSEDYNVIRANNTTSALHQQQQTIWNWIYAMESAETVIRSLTFVFLGYLSSILQANNYAVELVQNDTLCTLYLRH